MEVSIISESFSGHNKQFQRQRKMTRTVGTIGAAGGFLILILEIISLATPNWIETGTRSVGLWKVCGAVIRCFDFSDGGKYTSRSTKTLNACSFEQICRQF